MFSHNPPLSGDFIEIDAFNLFEGAAFLENGHVHVAMAVRDYPVTEQIYVQSRIADDPDFEHRPRQIGDEAIGYELERPYLFHYMRKVALVGAVRNPQDFDDNNWGNS